MSNKHLQRRAGRFGRLLSDHAGDASLQIAPARCQVDWPTKWLDQIGSAGHQPAARPKGQQPAAHSAARPESVSSWRLNAILWPDRRLYPMLVVLMDAAQLADLICRAQRREPAAFDALVEAYSPRLYGYFYRLTGSRHDAEDLLQELFVRLVRMIGDYTHGGRFDGWLFRIATNLVRDRVRRAKKAAGAQVPGPGDVGAAGRLEDYPDTSAAQPSESVSRAEQLDQLQRAIGQLPEAEREVILLRHFSQMSFREIAGVMGTPLGTALARGHRGLARLRELMANKAD